MQFIFAIVSLSVSLVLFAQEVVIGEDVDGRVTVRAVRYDGEINIDGRLDESIYSSVAPMSDFIQNLPDDGAPASEKTEVWVFYDDDNIYVTAKNYESVPEEDWVANEMRRDTFQLRTNDSFSVMAFLILPFLMKVIVGVE